MTNKSQWEQMTQGKYFITDLGKTIKVPDENGNLIEGRYAVWKPISENRHAILEVSNNVLELRQKYNILENVVFKLNETTQ